jgi:RNA ligase
MTLHYEFPTITHIDDVLPHIDDSFVKVERDGMIFINYIFASNQTFPPVTDRGSAIRRECRGITFDATTGEIISRPFHKVFNAGEREDLQLDMIDLTRPHSPLVKLDGSMLRPFRVGNKIRWGTKMGLTDVAKLTDEFVANSDIKYNTFAEVMIEGGYTPLFEHCTNKNRIVLSYPEEMLVLLAIRDTKTGEYMNRSGMGKLADVFGIPFVDSMSHGIGYSDMGSLVDNVREMPENSGEGIVLMFDNGHAVKIKADWYVRVHKAIDNTNSEISMIDLYFNNELDDILPTLDERHQTRVRKYIQSLEDAMAAKVGKIHETFVHVKENFESPKDFATSHYAKNMCPLTKPMVFDHMNRGKDAKTCLIEVMQKAAGRKIRFAEFREKFDFDTGWEDSWT